MADTIGSLVDKLATTNSKMFHNQEFLYKIKRMTPDDFLTTFSDEEELIGLYRNLLKIADLNLQRQALILEHDKLLVDLVLDLLDNPENKSKYIVDQHKTAGG